MNKRSCGTSVNKWSEVVTSQLLVTIRIMEVATNILFSTVTILFFLSWFARGDRINIIPTLETSCPSAIIGKPCFTLQQYIENPSFSSDIILELYPGNHRMDSQLLALNINSFTMRATKTASIFCSQQLQPGDYYWFNLTRVQMVDVKGIAFNGWSVYFGET